MADHPRDGMRGVGFNLPHAVPLPDISPVMRPHAPRVAILVDTATGWGRRLVYGVMAYARKHGPWHIWVEPRGQQEHLRTPPGWAGEGIIARVATKAMARELTDQRLPIVNVSGIQLRGAPDFPRVTTDLRAAGNLAASHFLDRGFSNFAYVGMSRLAYVREYARGFVETVEARKHSCHIYRPLTSATGWKEQQAELGQWLRALPKPLALFAWGLRGLSVLEACHSAGLRVPAEVAVLAGDEDDLLCEAANPPLSGVETPTELIGHEAAATLDRLMKKLSPPPEPQLFAPTRIVTRQSTDTLAIEDPEVAAAVQFIRDNAAQPHVDVPAVLRAVPISRRALERRFEQVFGHTPAEEIRRVRLDRARQLLLETDMPIPNVATAA
ncbi:MAG TPA: substrate-binding domain-containing protein, partial [Tepidisphaeraceae bacterium]|nr:substrate-binding domain-containing protein [Tepidisphaeraceae bacterium]